MKKRLAAFLLVWAVLFTSACGKKSDLVSGSFSGNAKGYGGDIRVTITLENSVITRCTAEGPNETMGIGSVAVEKLPSQIASTNSIAVDTISGATISSNAILAAAKEALTTAGLDPQNYSQKKDNGIDQAVEKTADVVVVGAGGAGMTAAITAAKEGKQVIIVESQSIVGGNSVRATGGMNAAKTDAQDKNEFTESAGVDKVLAAAQNYADNKSISALAATVAKQWADYKANPTGYFDSPELFALDTLIGGKGLNNPQLVKTLAENSADSISWLASIGADMHNVGSFGGASVKRIHRPVDNEGKVISVGPFISSVLETNCKELGIEILLDTTADKILTGDGGAVTGVSGKNKSGGAVTVHAGAVVLATGGFGANLDMVVQYKPDLAGFVSTNAAGAQGQGIEMAVAVGAATVDMEQIQIHPTVEQKTSWLITEGLRGDGAILVNSEGKRFCDEVGTRDAVSAAEIAQPGGFAWLIVDQKMVDASSVISGYLEKGFATKGESAEALAQAIEVNEAALTATITTWNASVAAGKDAEFGRTSFAQPLDTAPYYAIKVAPGVHHTMGGLSIDSSAQVLDKAGQAIPALFAAGEVTGGVHGANRLGGNAVADYVVFGRIAGKSAANYTPAS